MGGKENRYETIVFVVSTPCMMLKSYPASNDLRASLGVATDANKFSIHGAAEETGLAPASQLTCTTTSAWSLA